jgi:hypothetical protein
MARARGKKPPARVISRPAVLPPTKDAATRTLLDGIDALAEQLRRASAEKSTWKIIKAKATSIWVVHVKQHGDWDWKAINDVFHKVESLRTVYKDISDRRLSFARLHYQQLDRDGEVENTGWYSPSRLTTWENLVKALQSESNMDDAGSRARRYENTAIDIIVFSFASRVQ